MASNVLNTGTAVPLPLTNDDSQVTAGTDGNVIVPGQPGAGNVHAGTAVVGAQDPFAKDEGGRTKAPSSINGAANATPFDPDYGALKEVFDQYDFKAPTESQLKTMAPVAEQMPSFGQLVQSVKTSIAQKDDSLLPKPTQYLSSYQEMMTASRENTLALQQASNQRVLDKLGKGDDDDDQLSKIKNPAAIVMLVMLKAKKEITQQKKDDIVQLQKYSTISDLMNNVLNNSYLPAQKELSDKVAKAKDKNKDKQEVEVPNIQDINLDNYISDDNGQPQLQTSTGLDKNGAAGPETITMKQTDLNSKIQQFQNQLQQVGSRISREQTNYQGHDQQDSTLSNIITSTQKTFADSSSAILRNIQ